MKIPFEFSCFLQQKSLIKSGFFAQVSFLFTWDGGSGGNRTHVLLGCQKTFYILIPLIFLKIGCERTRRRFRTGLIILCVPPAARTRFFRLFNAVSSADGRTKADASFKNEVTLLKRILHYYLHLNFSECFYAATPSAVCLSFRSPAIETFTPPFAESLRNIIIHAFLANVNSSLLFF